MLWQRLRRLETISGCVRMILSARASATCYEAANCSTSSKVMLGRLIGAPRHWFSDLQWDLEEPSGSRQPLRPASGLGPALQSKRDLAVKSTSQDTEHPHPERPQEDWAQRSFSEAGVLTAHSQSEEPRLRPQLSEDGTLDAAQPVRFVAEGGNHRVTTYGEAAAEAESADTRLLVVNLDADPPVVKLESVVNEASKPKTMRQQKESIKEKRKRDLEQRRANTFKEVRVGFKNADNDLNRQLKGAQDLLGQGYRVKIIYLFHLKDLAAAKEKFLAFKHDVDAWGYFEQVDGENIRQRKMGGGQSAFLILLLPKRVKK